MLNMSGPNLNNSRYSDTEVKCYRTHFQLIPLLPLLAYSGTATMRQWMGFIFIPLFQPRLKVAIAGLRVNFRRAKFLSSTMVKPVSELSDHAQILIR